jgi:hypothetical protein
MTSRSQLRKFKSLYIWHRYAGLIAAVFVLILAFTGIILNHTDRLKLDSSFVESEWLLDWYGIDAPQVQKSFHLDKQWLTHVDDSLFLGVQRIEGHYSMPPVGALSFPHFIAVAVAGKIVLITREGEIIERLGGVQGVPSGMQRMGLLADGRIVIQAAHGYYLTDRDFLQWNEKEQVEGISWSTLTDMPVTLKKEVARLYRSNELPMERVMLDLHSGRLFGSWGPQLMDAAAILLIFLSMSGVWLWTKQILRKRQRRLKKHSH